MRLSDAGLRRRQSEILYLNHRLPPWLTEDTPRDRLNRLLDGSVPGQPKRQRRSAKYKM
jgi:hypothetical protein